MSGVEGNQQQQPHSYTSTSYQNQPQSAPLSERLNFDRKPPSTPSRLGAYFRDQSEGLLRGGGLSPFKFQHAWILETVSVNVVLEIGCSWSSREGDHGDRLDCVVSVCRPMLMLSL